MYSISNHIERKKLFGLKLLCTYKATGDDETQESFCGFTFFFRNPLTQGRKTKNRYTLT